MSTYIREYFPMENGEEMEVRLGYSLGGVNYFNYQTEKRGLWLYFTPVRRDTTDGVSSTQRTLMDDRGRKILVRELNRKSAKAATELREKIEPLLPVLAKAAIEQDWAAIQAQVRD